MKLKSCCIYVYTNYPHPGAGSRGLYLCHHHRGVLLREAALAATHDACCSSAVFGAELGGTQSQGHQLGGDPRIEHPIY